MSATAAATAADIGNRMMARYGAPIRDELLARDVWPLCPKCGDRGAVWITDEGLVNCEFCRADYVELLDALEVPGASTPRGVGTLAPSTETPMKTGDSGVPPGGTPGTPPAVEKLRLLDIDRMLATTPPPVPWLVEPLLAQGCVTMLAGREGQGKSMLALALAAAIGHGANVAGFDCQPGRVLYVDAENGEREAHRRIHGLGVKPGALVYAEANGFGLATDIALLAGLIDEHKPTVLVLDSLRSLAPGLDENDSRPVEAALRPVSRLAQVKGLPVLLLHHAGKSGLEYRGSTAIGAAVEIGFTLAWHEDDPDKRRRRRLSCWKSRPAPMPDTRWLTIEPDGESILLGEAEPFQPSAPARENAEEQLLGSLNGYPTTWSQWARDAGLDPKSGTARRARDSLAGQQRVAQDDDGNWTVAP